MWSVVASPVGFTDNTAPVKTAAADPTGTPEPTPTPNPAVTGISRTRILYTTEEIEVQVSTTNPVYYAILKNKDQQTVKASELLPAAANVYGSAYLIDFSTMSASKEGYIGVTTTVVPGEDGTVPVINLAIQPNAKKIVFNVNWAIEGSEARGINILQNVIVSNNNGTTTTYQQGSIASGSIGRLSDLNIQWRKGSNGAWNSMADLTADRWESMKTAGAVIYFRLAARDQTDVDPGCRYSKENKIKCAITKATAIKADPSKLTVSIKNGMQFRLAGAPVWYTVLPYSSASHTETAVRNRTLSTSFDPFTENTSQKKQYLSLDELYTTLNVMPPVGDEVVTVEARIAATSKKPASKLSAITLTAQGAAPTAVITASEDSYKVTGLSVPTPTPTSTPVPTGTPTGTPAPTPTPAPTATPQYEYFIADLADINTRSIDMSNIKWASVKEGTVLKKTLKCTYTRLDGVRKTVIITDRNAALMIRVRGAAASSKSTLVLASNYITLPVPTYAPTTPTP